MLSFTKSCRRAPKSFFFPDTKRQLALAASRQRFAPAYSSHFGLSHIDMAPTRALQRKVSQLFRMRGWQLRPDAMQRLYELLNGEDDWE